jgi:hypothetical protein
VNGVLTDERRGDLAEEMLPVAANLAALVHGDGGRQDIGEVLGGLDDDQRTALIVVLAGLVDPDRPLGALLGWLNFDEHGAAAPAAWSDRQTLRQIADEHESAVADGTAFVDEGAVDGYMTGRMSQVTPPERLEAIRRGVAQGMTYRQFDEMHGLPRSATDDWMSKVRHRTEKYGEPFPAMMPDAPRDFSESDIVRIRTLAVAGHSMTGIGREYGVTRQAINRIATGVSYKQMGGPLREVRQRTASVAA